MLNENIEKLAASDVLLASFPNSGSSLLGGMLLSLGVNYVEGYQEALGEGANSSVVDAYWRSRWSALASKDAAGGLFSRRIVKTHNFPDAFGRAKCRRAIVLVRDPRDAAISYFHWLKDFSSVPSDLGTFIRENGSFFGFTPFPGWKAYIERWAAMDAAWQVMFVTYEELKFRPLPALARVADFLHLDPDRGAMEAAVRSNGFARLREQEDASIDERVVVHRRAVAALQRNDPNLDRSDFIGPAPATARIFRRGLVGEWRGALDAADLAGLDEAMQPLLREFGYRSSIPLLPAADLVFMGLGSAAAQMALEAAASGERRVLLLNAPGGSRSEAAAALPSSVARWILAENPDAKVRAIDAAIEPMHLDWLSGDVVLDCANEEFARAVEAACLSKSLKLRRPGPEARARDIAIQAAVR